MRRFSGRTVLVTGAAQGIGEAIVRRFAAEGARVAACDRQAVRVTALADALRREGADVLPLPLDLTDPAAYHGAIDALAADGGIDVLVNNAAIFEPAGVLEATPEHWERTRRVNLDAVFLGTRHFAAQLVRLGRAGSVVQIASGEAIRTEPRTAAYTATKGAVLAFTQACAVDLAPHGIRVNAVAPGCIHTPLSVIDGVDETTTPDFQEWFVRRRKIPLARPGRSAEVAAAVAFLASDDASYMTGTCLVVDGGLTITF